MKMQRPKRSILAAAIGLAVAGPLLAQAPDCTGISDVFNSDPDLVGELTAVRVATGLARPIFATAAPGDMERLFIVEQTGRIKIVKSGTLLPDPFINLDPIVTGGSGGERGLLGLAFHPDYQNNRYFFVYYTATASNGGIVVARYERDPDDPDAADPDSGVTILTVPHSAYSNHNGGMIAFGPLDGLLYIGTGDGGSSCDPGNDPGYAQDLDSLLGKMLRVDVDNLPDTVPQGNPFGDEIWDYGLRNPWRWSFDRITGAQYIGDVGQSIWEEINCTPAGTGGDNYGWVPYEGTHCENPSCSEVKKEDCNLSDHLPPVREYDQAGVPCAVIGGYVYRGCRMSALQGTYFYSDACDPFIKTFRTDGSCQVTPTPDVDRENDIAPGGGIFIGSIVSFGEDNQGELYTVGLNGDVFKILPELSIMELSGPNAQPFVMDESGSFVWEDLGATSDHPIRFFKVYRATQTDGDGVPGPFVCLHRQTSTSTSWIGDMDEPTAGQVFYYLVTAQNEDLEETTAGAGSDGNLREVDTDDLDCLD